MKKIANLMLLLGMAAQLVANAQTNAPAADWTNSAAATPALASTNAAPASADTNTIATAPAPTPAAADTNAPAAAPAPAPASAPTSSIPLIQFSDVPITTAIENLARQAGINYMLDPKIGYGQPDATGQVKVEPQLSIRWENISAENALLALLDNYNLQLNRDKNTSIDRITMKDPAAPPPLITRVVQLQYASVPNMTEALQSALTDKRSKVLGDKRTSQLVVVATDPEQNAVDTLVKQLDTPTKQVLIETKLIEISSQPSTKKGVDWSSTLSAQTVTFGNGSLAGNTKVASSAVTTEGGGHTDPVKTTDTILNLVQGNGGFSASTLSGLIPMTGFLNADGVKAVISFLNSTYDAQVMSTPRIVTLDNETADISVTRQVPIINFSGGTQNSSGSSSITYSNVGTILQVTPRISANEKIWLKVAPEVSSKFGDVTVTVPGGQGNPSTSFPVPVFDVRKMTTQVLVPNGSTLVMGGLVQDAPSASYNKVPFLGDVPALGWAFRSESKSMSKDNLIIFMTPTIVQDTDFRSTPSTFLQSQPETMKSPLNPRTMWDSGAARGNWSNPAPNPGEFDGKPALHNF
jgi:type II secretory pathway component GspD/PulD (secretin)